ncbi:peptidoglycan DD-metalloendopeptidase family protein [Colwellia sp. MSW7]|uniref:Peptidoglycan DD-metalloendopeptidase family protein n=1 Tax=Colwellia maritima TaxID=2912588 RepID=A0ABS9WWL3_9GAMM|nr:peptidoglycan DD-metalloendopeptidase family protein [Colwellia maritima]MCI2282189.1 peptidoglycan DD-metalloendopeptidase family protein [Colwellia maritima]
MASESSNEIAKQRNAAKLNDVQQAIAKQESNIFAKNKARSVLEKQLKDDDLAIAKVAKAISDTEQALKDTQQKISILSDEKKQLTSQKLTQEQLLAKQLRSAYTTGQHDYLKLLLNQAQSEKIQRTITYYQYMNKARIDEIEKFQATIAQLVTVSAKHKEQVEQLQSLKQSQQKQRTKLSKNKDSRSKTLASLGKELLSSKQKLAKLKADEANLAAALQKLAALIRAEVDLMGLSKLKRKLSWPVKGRLLRSFGSKKQGYLKWKGVLLGAPVGRQVQTIHNGTVIFSDWLKGYGLLTVIDHGKGYMSLYAHNQTLLKSVGDQVETGEPIALVGQSGGQDQVGLYFEIRHQGQAVNPRLWCR